MLFNAASSVQLEGGKEEEEEEEAAARLHAPSCLSVCVLLSSRVRLLAAGAKRHNFAMAEHVTAQGPTAGGARFQAVFQIRKGLELTGLTGVRGRSQFKTKTRFNIFLRSPGQADCCRPATVGGAAAAHVTHHHALHRNHRPLLPLARTPKTCGLAHSSSAVLTSTAIKCCIELKSVTYYCARTNI